MSDYDENVFINCPFDGAYRPLLDAVVFAVHDCGFVARCALEAEDSSVIRIQKIARIIAQCRFGIHDISRTEADGATGLPRFNMPLELGLFLGAKRFGRGRQRRKLCLVLDRERFRYQKFCSDIAGQDIKAHGDDPATLVRIVRDWLRNATTGSGTVMPGGRRIFERYTLFRRELPLLCAQVGLDPDDLIFNDYTTFVAEWLKANA